MVGPQEDKWTQNRVTFMRGTNAVYISVCVAVVVV